MLALKNPRDRETVSTSSNGSRFEKLSLSLLFVSKKKGPRLEKLGSSLEKGRRRGTLIKRWLYLSEIRFPLAKYFAPVDSNPLNIAFFLLGKTSSVDECLCSGSDRFFCVGWKSVSGSFVLKKKSVNFWHANGSVRWNDTRVFGRLIFLALRNLRKSLKYRDLLKNGSIDRNVKSVSRGRPKFSVVVRRKKCRILELSIRKYPPTTKPDKYYGRIDFSVQAFLSADIRANVPRFSRQTRRCANGSRYGTLL